MHSVSLQQISLDNDKKEISIDCIYYPIQAFKLSKFSGKEPSERSTSLGEKRPKIFMPWKSFQYQKMWPRKNYKISRQSTKYSRR